MPGLKYLATNRALDDLAGIIDPSQIDGGETARDLRLTLSRGGHYFVNMDNYLAYYLGEVNEEKLPFDCIVQSSDDEVFHQFINHPRVNRVVICIHGFNVALRDAHEWFRILFETMKRGAGQVILAERPADIPTTGNADVIAAVGFSWPSNGSALSYNRDQADARASASALAALIIRIRRLGKEVDLLCHSMGNYVACNMLWELVDEKLLPPNILKTDDTAPKEKISPEALQTMIRRGNLQGEKSTRSDFLIRKFVMIAPDVERRHVTKNAGMTSGTSYVGPYYSGLQHLVGEVVNFYSRFDSALTISNLEKAPKKAALAITDLASKLFDFLERNPDYKWEQRLGSSAHPVTAPPNMRSVNASELANRKIDHSDHIDCPPVVAEIAKALLT